MLLKRLHRPLIITSALMFLLALVSVAGLILDDRTLLGVPIWLKPLKFSISLAIYAITLAWLISMVEKRPRVTNVLGWVISAGAVIEMIVIVGQVIRGRQSHFNAATPLDTALFSVMGMTIVAVWFSTAWVAVLLMIQRLPDRAVALAVRFGLIIALVGLGTGFLMTSPTPTQLDDLNAGGAPTVIGAHAVGVPDGGPGIPLVNWSSEGGDLRVPHFVGMHALQALPLLAFGLVLLSRRLPRLRDNATRARLIVVAALTYGAVTGLAIWQALRGQPLIHPDSLTLTTLGAILGIAAVATIAALIRRPATVSPPPTVAAETADRSDDAEVGAR